MTRALDGYCCKVQAYTPKITPFPKSRINGLFLPIAIKNILRHRLERIESREIHFWISVVNGRIDHDRSHFSANKVVLLSVAMQE